MSGGKSELSTVPTKEGNAARADPAEGRESRRYGTDGREDARETELGKRLNENPADSRAGEEHAAAGADDTRSPHRSRVAQGGISADPEGCSPRRGRSDGRGGFRQARRKPGRTTQPVQGRHVQGAPRPAGPHPE